MSSASARRLATMTVMALGACTLAPKYERPALPVANQFPGSGTLVAADQGWRTVFGDPRLQALIALALRNNRDLRIAALNVEETRAQYRIERAGLFPEVDATGRASFQRGTALAPRYTVGASASYELDLFGRVRSLTAAALQEYLSTQEAHRAAHLALVGEVASQYLRERAYDEQEQLAERTLAVATEFASLSQRLLEAGSRSELDFRAAEAQVASARSEVARLTRLREQATNALAVLVGQALPASLPAPRPLESQAIVAELGAGVSSEILLRRPDVLAAVLALQAANANVGAARAAFFPTISLTAFAGFASSALASLFTAGAATWTFAPQLSVPLFTGGRNAANLDVAKVRTRIEVARYEQAIQVAFREVADALVARKYLDEQLAAVVARVDAEEKRDEISDQRYRGGIESYLSVLDAHRDLYVAQTQLIEVRLSRLQTLAELYRALGGGWLER
jgi:multidrug efflux system outer membrane protein